MGGFTYEEWEIDALWGRIKFFELASGLAFFCMNLLHSKDILGIYGTVIKKSSKSDWYRGFACVNDCSRMCSYKQQKSSVKGYIHFRRSTNVSVDKLQL